MSSNVNSAGISAGPLETLHFLTNRRVWVESPLRHGELDVYWMPRPFLTNRYPVGYNVYRSISPEIEPTSPDVLLLTLSPVTIPMFRDTTVDTYDSAHHYYLVTEVFTDGTETPLERPVTLYESVLRGRPTTLLSMPRIFREYRRRKYILLNNNAEPVDFLIRRRAGTRCSCFNPNHETTRFSNCPDCFGTGWDRGYELLRNVLCRVLSIKETLKLSPQGLQFKSSPRGWLVDFPLLRNGDAFVRRNGLRYEVNNLDYTMHQGVLTGQDFDAEVFPETHPVYNYIIPDSDALVPP